MNDKCVVVFGADGLLGSKVVMDAIKSGASVIAVDLHFTKGILRDLSEARGESVLSLQVLDICCENSVREFFNRQTQVDGIVNASYPRNESYGLDALEVTLNSFTENVSLQLGSNFVVMKHALLFFQRTRRPISIVNISSIYGVVPPDFSIYTDSESKFTMPIEYSASKSALIHLTKYFVKYESSPDFRVNCVSPGGIFNSHAKGFVDAYASKVFSDGLLDTDDVVGVILFLLSKSAHRINGQNIIVDDGFTL